jgi:hypothetical protein
MDINPTYIQGYANSITGIISDIIVPVLISIAFLVFLWGVYKYFIKGSNDEKAHTEGRTYIMYGIIGFVVIFSIWGIVNIFGDTLGLYGFNAPDFPTIGNTTGTGSTIPTSGTPVSTLGNTGTTNTAGTSGTTAAQAQTYTAMTQAQSAYSAACTQYGSSSTQCQQATTNYQQAMNAYQGAGGTGNGVGNGVVNSICTDSSNCGGLLTCQNGKCAALGGETSAQCTYASDCAGTLVCTNGQCVAPASSNGTIANGGACSTASQCSGGYCNSDPTNPDFGVCASSAAGSSGSAATGNKANGQGCGANGGNSDTPDCSCADSFCQGDGQSCSDGCGGTCSGTQYCGQ